MSHSIAFLITPAQAHNDNHLRLPRLFAEAGWSVTQVVHDALRIDGGEVYIDTTPGTHFDLIWPVGLGPRQTFLDRQQILALLDQDRLITPAHAYLSLHGKTAWLHHSPPTAVANRAATLIEVFQANDSVWVLKPAAGSFGTDVTLVHSAAEIEHRVGKAAEQYWMLQRYIPEISAGETRTLICGDTIIGSYLRMPGRGFRANLAAHGQASQTTLDATSQQLVATVHAELQAHRVGFAAIDTVGGYLMEVNLANPGGLQTLAELYGHDSDAKFTQAISALTRRPGQG